MESKVNFANITSYQEKLKNFIHIDLKNQTAVDL